MRSQLSGTNRFSGNSTETKINHGPPLISVNCTNRLLGPKWLMTLKVWLIRIDYNYDIKTSQKYKLDTITHLQVPLNHKSALYFKILKNTNFAFSHTKQWRRTITLPLPKFHIKDLLLFLSRHISFYFSFSYFN